MRLFRRHEIGSPLDGATSDVQEHIRRHDRNAARDFSDSRLQYRFLMLVLLFTLLGVSCNTAFSGDASRTEGVFDLQREFATIRLNEKDLTKLVEIIDQLPKKFGGNLNIEVTSGDGEETVKTTDLKYFSSDQMLVYIRCVNIEYLQFGAPVSATLSIGSSYGWGGLTGTTLKVSGTDKVAVFGIFRELERELEPHQAAIEWFGANLGLFNFLMNIVCLVLLGVLGAVSVGIVLEKGVARFAHGVTRNEVFAPVVTTALAVCGFGSLWLLNRCFGPVRFTGALSDPSSAICSHFAVIGTAVVSPIVLNIIGGLVTRVLPPASMAKPPEGKES